MMTAESYVVETFSFQVSDDFTMFYVKFLCLVVVIAAVIAIE